MNKPNNVEKPLDEGLQAENASGAEEAPVKQAAHKTSLAVWDIASPVECASAFRIKVGAKCAHSCSLAGLGVGIYDDSGTLQGFGQLSFDVFSESVALYWLEIELAAPQAEGNYVWEARLDESRLDIGGFDIEGRTAGPADSVEPVEHAAAIKGFSFSAKAKAQYKVNIAVVGKDTQAYPGRTVVMLRPYRNYTGDDGVAAFEVAPGQYMLFARADKYEDYNEVIQIEADLDLRIELEPSEYEEDYRGNMIRIEKPSS
ncbi:MAG: hypothetical protein FWH40_06930 [Coriobacteriia bacterium]|nr:hypothetical protein [Coriobacteriia bacterium]